MTKKIYKIVLLSVTLGSVCQSHATGTRRKSPSAGSGNEKQNINNKNTKQRRTKGKQKTSHVGA